jgi:hypothetical protein
MELLAILVALVAVVVAIAAFEMRLESLGWTAIAVTLLALAGVL